MLLIKASSIQITPQYSSYIGSCHTQHLAHTCAMYQCAQMKLNSLHVASVQPIIEGEDSLQGQNRQLLQFNVPLEDN